jgi:hypothetical protein
LEYFRSIKGFTFTRALYDPQGHFFNSLKGGVSLIARRTLATSAYGDPVFSEARVDNAVIICSTEGTAHKAHDTPKTLKY